MKENPRRMRGDIEKKGLDQTARSVGLQLKDACRVATRREAQHEPTKTWSCPVHRRLSRIWRRIRRQRVRQWRLGWRHYDGGIAPIVDADIDARIQLRSRRYRTEGPAGPDRDTGTANANEHAGILGNGSA